jgi:hypothetical protein
MAILYSLQRKVLLTYLSKIFEGKYLTNNFMHKLVFLIQSVPYAPKYCDFFYFKKEGPVSSTLDIDLITTEYIEGIAYYNNQNNKVAFPGIGTQGLKIVPGFNCFDICKKNHLFLREMKPFVDIVLDLGSNEEEYSLLASIVYIDRHIEEFIKENITDKVDFITMIMQEYRPTRKEEVSHFRHLLKSRNFVGDLSCLQKKLD